MKSTLLLLRHDLRRATSNVMAVIVLFGLVIIPSLFTWFNVIASWNPFDNTRNLTVAVANTDEGYQSDLIPLRINIGEQVLSALGANNDLDWVITSKEDAIDGTRSGEYYAAIVLPEQFSADMMTFYVNGAKPTAIEYYTNEKKNALAPKITDQGAGEVSTSINAAFAETLGEVGLSIISSLSDHLDDADTQVALSRLQAHVDSAAARLRAGADTAEMFGGLISSSSSLVRSAADLADASGRSLRDASTAIGGGVDAARSLKDTLGSAADALSSAFSASADSYAAVADRIDDVFTTLDAQSQSAAGAITALADRVQTQTEQYQSLRDDLVTNVRPALPEELRGELDLVVSRIDGAIARQQALQDRLEDAAANVTGGNADRQAAHQQILALIDEAKQAVQTAKDAYDGSLRPKLDRLATTLSQIDSGIASIRGDLSAASSTLSGGTDSLLGALTQAESTTAAIAQSLAEAADRFDELGAALSTALDTGDLTALTDAIGADPAVLATSLSAPVSLDRIAVFSVVSFGAAMTPLYTVLALWVGALLISVSIRVDVPAGGRSDLPPLTLTQTYLGRYGIFWLIGFLQSSLLGLGSVLFTQVQPAHPLLLILAGWVMSLVFTLITYTFVVTFGNAGKALAVLLLVIQISSSGGAYPLQVLPQWFQNISPFLPATHAVSAMRSAIAGVHNGDYWISLGWLALFIVPTLLLGLVIRRPLIGFNQNLLRALESTKLM